MKKISLLLVVVVLFSVSAVTGKPQESMACIICSRILNCYQCFLSRVFNGGFFCRTYGCSRCVTTNTCRIRPIGPTPLDSAAQYPSKIADDTIREIAQTHPRFAAILAQGNSAGWDNVDSQQVYFPPVEISQSEIGYWLLPEDNPEAIAYFEEFEKRAQALFAQGKADFIHEITLTKDSDTTTTLMLKVVSGVDPGEPQLKQMRLVLAKQGQTWIGIQSQFQ